MRHTGWFVETAAAWVIETGFSFLVRSTWLGFNVSWIETHPVPAKMAGMVGLVDQSFLFRTCKEALQELGDDGYVDVDCLRLSMMLERYIRSEAASIVKFMCVKPAFIRPSICIYMQIVSL